MSLLTPSGYTVSTPSSTLLQPLIYRWQFVSYQYVSYVESTTNSWLSTGINTAHANVLVDGVPSCII